MIIHIMAGGPTQLHPDFALYQEEDVIWAAVDRGVFHLLQRGIIPFVAFGDYDSVSAQELEWMRKRMEDLPMMPREKDETDLEVAINWALQQNPDKIRVFGATGGRLDHELANVHLLRKGIHSQAELILIDSKNEIEMKKPSTYVIEKKNSFPYVSFLSVSEQVHGITLHGFKYPLTNRTLQMGSTLCISNELVAEKGTFSFSSGILLVVRSTD
ncbi:thiamine diphosphokinase [Ectobacillus polymachus]|uniref:thiamine diphosphokinase n=1 Tax=Ectobacillus polymachus TaxID=1508806 RepID=UPI003A8B3B5E